MASLHEEFDDEFTVERTKILPELSINYIVKILSLKKQYTLVTLNRTPLQADDAEITDYLSKFGTLKGPIKRRTYTEGPLKGIENGTITALMSLETPIPSYHWLQGKRTSIWRVIITQPEWEIEPIHQSQLAKTIDSLPNKSSTGPDQCSFKLLKLLKTVIT